ncbi:MAG TPA: 30S ribosomal protein S18 [bacterium]|uniref:Small ribosomal subunit protein bS18 n=1 Tax=candidate division TA06 bacterium ADurb.Bin417 TaxID=1852828 RepID=A0A1V5MK46_UNCT6|nr:MAG: 30S ribosomal protein S18 [candidate division TA06 bacterium ADurb.Bin417]HNQ34506.1 30S ribosomal protein S18 [bacterium]HNS48048.1 30S ribosomal protein S18 [bacterium]
MIPRKKKRERRGRRSLIARKCRFCEMGLVDIDYKDTGVLRRYLSVRGKMISARFTGTCAKHQRKLSLAIKRGRYMGLLPYIIR